MMNLNTLPFGYQSSDHLIVIKEQQFAEANFAFAQLMQQALMDKNNRVICLLVHNTIGHLMSVGMRLDSNFVNKLKAGVIKVIDVQELVLQTIDNPQLDILNEISNSIDTHVNDFISMNKTDGKAFIFIDDFTDLQDYTHDLSQSMNFLNKLLGLHYNTANVMYIVGLHIGSKNDKILSTALEYSADSIIDISIMSTGRSVDVDGVMKIVRNRKLTKYHYKIKDYGVEFAIPGKFIIS